MIEDIDYLFWPKTLEKGRSIDKKNVSNVSITEDIITANVCGEHLYNVFIYRDFSAMGCTCPCQGFYCKHLAAFILYLADEYKDEGIFDGYHGSEIERIAIANREKVRIKEEEFRRKQREKAERYLVNEEKRAKAKQKKEADDAERQARREERLKLEEERRIRREERERKALERAKEKQRLLEEKQKQIEENALRLEVLRKQILEEQEKYRVFKEQEEQKKENIRLSKEADEKVRAERRRQNQIDRETKKAIKTLPEDIREKIKEDEKQLKNLERDLGGYNNFELSDDEDELVYITEQKEKGSKVLYLNGREITADYYIDLETGSEYYVIDYIKPTILKLKKH